MITEVNAVSFRQRLGEMLGHVQYAGDSVVVTKDGTPVAALIDPMLFGQIRALRDRFDSLTQRVEKGYADVPQDEGLAEIDALVAAERGKR